MDRQDVFNRSVTGLASQSFQRSVVQGPTTELCQYRSGNRRCAVGWLIEDKHYHSDLESLRASHSCVTGALAKSGIFATDYREQAFLEGLQRCHDSAQHPEDMKDRLREFARVHDLDLPEALQ